MYFVLKLKKSMYPETKNHLEFRDFKEREKGKENIYYVVDLL